MRPAALLILPLITGCALIDALSGGGDPTAPTCTEGVPCFAGHEGFEVALHPVVLAVGNINEDQCPDIAVAGPGEPSGHVVQVLWSDCGGWFEVGPSYPISQPAQDLVIVDMNREGGGEVVVIGDQGGGAGSIHVFKHTTGPNLTVQMEKYVTFDPVRAVPMDLENNGWMDLVVVTRTSLQAVTNTDGTALNPGMFWNVPDIGVLHSATLMPKESQPTLAVGGDSGVRLYFANAGSLYPGQLLESHPKTVALVAVSVDQDSADELILVEACPGVCNPIARAVKLNNALTLELAVPEPWLPRPHDVAPAHFGKPGFIVANGNGNRAEPPDLMVAYQEEGSGLYLTVGFEAGLTPERIATGDFNRDGLTDVAAIGGNEIYVKVVMGRSPSGGP